MHLIVVLEDRISEWVAKGEILEGYFNPDGAFEKVTVVALTADQVDKAVISTLCKPANCVYLNAKLNRKRLLLPRWSSLFNFLTKKLTPLLSPLGLGSANLVRGYGEGLSAVASSVIASALDIPFVVSLHQTGDPKIMADHSTLKDRIWRKAIKFPVRQSLYAADGLIAVYSPILEYLPEVIASRTEVIPNVVGVRARPNIEKKVGNQLNLISVGRQMPGRDPRPIIEAVAQKPDVQLTLVGTGSLHSSVRDCVRRLGVRDRVRLIQSIPNSELCKRINQYDLMLINSDFREISKSLMEAALSGVPIVINQRPAAGTAEFRNFPITYCEGDAMSYCELLTGFAKDPNRRYQLSEETADAAWSTWDPGRVGLTTAKFLLKVVERKC